MRKHAAQLTWDAVARHVAVATPSFRWAGMHTEAAEDAEV
jgi:hypothetical protein